MSSVRTNHTEFTSDRQTWGSRRYKPGLSTTRMFRQDGSLHARDKVTKTGPFGTEACSDQSKRNVRSIRVYVHRLYGGEPKGVIQ
jgi:hypothetical protein